MHRQKQKKRMMYGCLCLFIVLIAIIVPTVITVTSEEDDVIVELVPTISPSGAPSPSPSSAPTSSDFDEFLGIIKVLVSFFCFGSRLSLPRQLITHLILFTC